MKRLLPFLLLAVLTFSVVGQIRFVDRDSIPYGGNFEGVDYGDVHFFDMDGDLDSDVLIIGDNGPLFTAVVYENNSGEFSEKWREDFDVAIGGVVFLSSDVSDVDGDNDIDFVLAGPAETRLYINDGSGNFTKDLSNTFDEVGRNRFGDLIFGDINGDTFEDLLFNGNITPGELYIYSNNGSGVFTFQSVQTGLEVGTIELIDFDNDNDNDVIITGRDDQGDGKAILFENNGSGVLTDSGVELTDMGSEGDIEVADVDDNGFDDIFICGFQNIGFNGFDINPFLYLNNGDGTFTIKTGQPFSSSSNEQAEFADVDGDDDLDLLLSGRFGQEPILLYLNDGSANFTEDTRTTFPEFENGSLAVADVDGDDDIDFMQIGESTDGKVAVLFSNDGTGAFTEARGQMLGANSDGVVKFADINGDAFPDLLVVGDVVGGNDARTYINDTQGNFSELFNDQLISASNTRGEAMADFGDIDGDQDLDLVIGGGNSTVLYRNDGEGYFEVVGGTPFSGVGGSVVFADFNGDTFLDLFNLGLQSEVYLNNGSGVFTLKTGNSFQIVESNNVTVGDIDGDTDYDILVSGRNTSDELVFLIYKNDGTGNFQLQNSSIPGFCCGSTIALRDVNQDGSPDLYLAGGGSSESNRLYLNDGTGTFTFQQTTGSGRNNVLVDVNTDGFPDLVGTNLSVVYLNQQEEGFTLESNAETVDANLIRGWIDYADIDADGDQDIVYSGFNQSSADARTKLFINETNSQPVISSANSTSVAENTISAVIDINAADLEGDNTDDVGMTYSLVGSGDGALFTIDAGSGALSFTEAPNFESPQDIGADNVYEVSIEVTDGFNIVAQELEITVTDENDPPTDLNLSSLSIIENNEVQDLVGLLTTTDEDNADTHTYSLVSGDGSDDNISFSIQDDQLLAGAVFNSLQQSTYAIRIRTTDAQGQTFEKAFQIDIVPEVTSLPVELDEVRYGKDVSDYQVISIPYIFQPGQNTVFNVFNEYGSDPDNELWRMIRFDTRTQAIVDITGGYQLQLGEGYFFIATEKRDVSVDNVVDNLANPSFLTVDEGWNLIGNPFNVDLDWDRIRTNNNVVSTVRELRVINPNNPAEWPTDNVLPAFEGGFVFSDARTTLQLTLDDAVGGRFEPIPRVEYEWFVPLTLELNGLSNSGGIGMHLQAVEGLDQYDQPTLPRWLSYLELNSLQPQSKFKLSQDIVGKKADYKWDFHFTSSESGEAVLSWPAADQLNLKLLDLASNQLIDMSQSTQHAMALEGGSTVSILYSEDPTEDFDEYVFDASAVYPNPTDDLLSLSIQVPRGESEADASVQLFNGAGKVLWEGQEAFAEGRHNWTISLRDYPEGVLFYTISILTKSNAQGHSHQSWTSTGKIVLRK